MADPVETEIKLAAAPSMLARLQDHPALAGKETKSELTTTYFDTADSQLHKAGMALRIRQSGSSREATLKLASPTSSHVKRREWTVPVDSDIPDVGAFPAPARALLAPVLGNLKLQPVATTRVSRTTRHLKHGQSAIEVAFDQGEIVAGNLTEPVSELELELLSGRFPDLAALALQLPLGPELRWSVAAKGQRGHALAYGIAPTPVHASAVTLTPEQDVATGFRAIAWNCLEQLLDNYPLVLAAADPEAIHQSRVAIRRLRAAMILFRKIVKDEQASLLRSELKAATSQLGAVRDLDVLLERVATKARPEDPDAVELLTHLQARRKATLNTAQKLLSSEQFQRLLLQIALWVEAGQWTERSAARGGDGPLEPFVAKVLKRRRRKLRRIGRNLDRIDDPARHRVRIEAKKLRYGVAFFASLYAGAADSEIGGFAKALAKLQDRLGELNDMAVAQTHRMALFKGLDPITAARLQAKLELLEKDTERQRDSLIRSARKALARVDDSAPWWKRGKKRT
ncbi:hypothetical protein MB02_16560 [Croceicoccus estronivorus]|uniref:CYTH and CHAD domain-containing protein n=1 Tax=Croceicoccus estronivorus TaxID=1172626 RepID=UPI000832FEFD|nr:CYTH and CHAD domain-containing protein [Croceicoccus estronivorus]OCC22471.1 hypothetical protein MB02_16560 [Croceicoccus estronivorus]